MTATQPAKTYRVQAFAALTGVTVRALHHYDRIGLLVPQRRAGDRGDVRGYREYTGRDLERLEQIVALQYLGFSLGQIKGLLAGKALPLRPALRLQQSLLREKQRRLERALGAIEAALAAGRPDPILLKNILQEMHMANDRQEWTDKYYSEAAKARLTARQPAFTPDMQADVSRRWAALLADVEAALGGDPAGAQAQALAQRWQALIGEFTQGDAEISAGLKKVWADRGNWPADMRQKAAGFRPEVMAFMQKALACGKK